ncbi:DUF2971 domain-containing protein [Halomonas sp. BMC6]|uniref:DUF2971 domain-containing protein n=1 Tax=Halomonas sp. BMC6 TaxID=3073244 RepID=UPI0030D321FD
MNDPLDSSISIRQEYERAKEIVEKLDDHPEKRKCFLFFLLDAHQFKDPNTGEELGLNGAVERFVQSVGIYSLSKTPRDALLWSHYADGHRGVCLGFETEELDIERVFISDHVEYRDQPAYKDIFLELVEELGSFVRPWDGHNYSDELGDEFYTQQLSRLMRGNLLVKSQKWQYEQEYRLVSGEAGLHTFPPQALKEIVLGNKISPEDYHTISNILSHPAYQHVELKKAQHIAGTFDFDITEV